MADVPSFTFRNIDFRIHNVASPSYAQAHDNFRVTVSYFVDHAKTVEAMKAILGWTEIIVLDKSAGFTYFSRHIPHTPTWNADLFDKVYAKAISSAEPKGALLKAVATDTPKFSDSLLTVTYEKLPYQIMEDVDITWAATEDPAGIPGPFAPWEGDGKRYLHIHEKDVSTTITTKGGEYVWDDDLNPDVGPVRIRTVGNGMPINVPRVEVVMTWYGIPLKNAPLERFESFRFKTNSAALGKYPARTLLFMGYDYEDAILGDLQSGCTIRLTFHYYPRGVDFFPDPERGGAFKRVVRHPALREPGDPTGAFASADFNAIFWPKL